MGIYIFQNTPRPEFLKLGSYVCRGKRENDGPYHRIARRGFKSCKHPEQLTLEDLEGSNFMLIAWFPNLNHKEEVLIHKNFNDIRIGEFYPAYMKEKLIDMCHNLGGILTPVPEESRAAAYAWAKKNAPPLKFQ